MTLTTVKFIVFYFWLVLSMLMQVIQLYLMHELQTFSPLFLSAVAQCCHCHQYFNGPSSSLLRAVEMHQQRTINPSTLNCLPQ